MSAHEPELDEIVGALSALATHEPDPRRAPRVRARCHTALATSQRRSRRAAAQPRLHRSWRRTLEPAIVGGLCAVFLFEVLSRALHLYRF
jgi:hypothetical protein